MCNTTGWSYRYIYYSVRNFLSTLLHAPAANRLRSFACMELIDGTHVPSAEDERPSDPLSICFSILTIFNWGAARPVVLPKRLERPTAYEPFQLARMPF